MIDYKRLSAIRKEKGVAWGHLESVINAYRGKFNDYQKDKTSFSEAEELLIANALNVSLEYLQGKTDIKERKNKPTDQISELRPELIKLKEITSDFTEEEFHTLLENAKLLALKRKLSKQE